MFEVEPDDVYESDGSEEGKLPMAMFTMERDSKARLLFDVSSRKMSGASSSAFPDATCCFENGGWLLMVQHKQPPAGFTEQAEAVFLVHPGTGRRIDLPAFVGSGSSSSSSLYVFYVSSSHGAPLVVARFTAVSSVPTAHVACPGDLYWSVYDYGGNGAGVDPLPWQACTSVPARCRLVKPASIADVALLGTQAVCLETDGGILVFDVAEMAWRRRRRRRTPAVGPDCGTAQYERYLVASESDGEVVLVSRPLAMGNAFRFFKLDMEALEWSPLEPRELDGTGWFLCRGQSFRAKEAGRRRVYTFSGPKERDRATSLKSITNVYAYD